jgi:hypothetical protein
MYLLIECLWWFTLVFSVSVILFSIWMVVRHRRNETR